jgi:hypothetical protein
MNWNYRVVQDADDMRIYDVYYDERGAPIARHETPSYVSGENMDDLRTQVELMLASLDKPVLMECEIGHSPLKA